MVDQFLKLKVYTETFYNVKTFKKITKSYGLYSTVKVNGKNIKLIINF